MDFEKLNELSIEELEVAKEKVLAAVKAKKEAKFIFGK